ncbi:MAG: hypothetical protein AB7S70_16920 [Hyphomicrobium sp.]|uniref:hypothetical protein n=1 Tax=Hyphomicrobium sp. TaxID=82 RepID=UPI003D14193B
MAATALGNAAAVPLWRTYTAGATPGAVLALGVRDARGGAIRDSILAAVGADPRLGATYTAELARGNADGSAAPAGVAARSVAHNALYATIMAHRASFPPDRFAILTDLGNGASITTEVPPAAARPDPAVAATGSSAGWRTAEARIAALSSGDGDAAASPLPARQRAEAAYAHID